MPHPSSPFTQTRTVIYLHGFASGPGSRKARLFREKLIAAGLSVQVPDLAQGDFPGLTLTRQLDLLSELVNPTGPPATLIGSSMGGYVAALWAARHPEAVDRLLLLAPAFGFAARWPELLGQEALTRWRDSGSMAVYHYAEQRQLPIGYQLFEDSQRYEPDPAISAPALILHGSNDAVVPIEYSRRFVTKNPSAKLVELNTDHEMTDTLDTLWDISRAFLVSE